MRICVECGGRCASLVSVLIFGTSMWSGIGRREDLCVVCMGKDGLAASFV